MNNVYYSPEKNGLSQLDCLDEPGLFYEYNTFCVWQHDKSGRVFYAQDSGCSCPTPFENYRFKSPDDNTLQEVTQDNFHVFEQEVNSFPVSMKERQDCLKTVADALKIN